MRRPAVFVATLVVALVVVAVVAPSVRAAPHDPSATSERELAAVRRRVAARVEPFVTAFRSHAAAAAAEFGADATLTFTNCPYCPWGGEWRGSEAVARAMSLIGQHTQQRECRVLSEDYDVESGRFVVALHLSFRPHLADPDRQDALPWRETACWLRGEVHTRTGALRSVDVVYQDGIGIGAVYKNTAQRRWAQFWTDLRLGDVGEHRLALTARDTLNITVFGRQFDDSTPFPRLRTWLRNNVAESIAFSPERALPSLLRTRAAFTFDADTLVSTKHRASRPAPNDTPTLFVNVERASDRLDTLVFGWTSEVRELMRPPMKWDKQVTDDGRTVQVARIEL